MRPQGSAAQLEARRMKALDLVRQGWRVKDVAETLGVSRSTVSVWKNTPGGKRALKAKPGYIKPCRLDDSQKKQLKKILLGGAMAAGFPTDLWTTRRVAEVVKEKFGIEYNPDHLGRILHDLGFSCQKPTRKAKEQDPQAIVEWRAKEWPRIKKGQKTGS